ncbi:MAG: CHC2 zinc finger domain-containing protein [Lawsonibacter sp.]
MAIPDRFLDELIARTDIVDLVSESVRLTKKGRNYWGLCPFHSEKTPSFSVSADKQIYKCFGCGKGGGAINFVMELDNLPFRDAVAVLAKRAGLEVPDSGYSAGAKERREKLLAINKQAARTFTSGCMPRRERRDWPICSGAACPAGPSPASAWALPPTGGMP